MEQTGWTDRWIDGKSTMVSGAPYLVSLTKRTPAAAAPPTAAEAIADQLWDSGFSCPWQDGEVGLEGAIQRLLDEKIIEIGDRLWVDVDHGLGRAKPDTRRRQ